MEPTDTNPLKPTFSRRLQSSTAVQRAPLWLMKATFPGRATVWAKVALKPRTGFITPRQLGPIRRILLRMVHGEECDVHVGCDFGGRRRFRRLVGARSVTAGKRQHSRDSDHN